MAVHLVTGGNGFLGSAIARKLLEKKEKVRLLDVIDDPQRPAQTEFYKISVLDREGLREAIEGVDYIHHNAALVPLTKSGKMYQRVNEEGTKNVLEIAEEFEVKHISHMSSSAIFGKLKEEEFPITEQTQPRPSDSYGRSKYNGEKLVISKIENKTFNAKNEQISYSIIRPRTILGTGRLGIFQILFEWISEGRNIYIIGDGSNLFQLAHVDDLVTASINSALYRKTEFLILEQTAIEPQEKI